MLGLDCEREIEQDNPIEEAGQSRWTWVPTLDAVHPTPRRRIWCDRVSGRKCVSLRVSARLVTASVECSTATLSVMTFPTQPQPRPWGFDPSSLSCRNLQRRCRLHAETRYIRYKVAAAAAPRNSWYHTRASPKGSHSEHFDTPVGMPIFHGPSIPPSIVLALTYTQLLTLNAGSKMTHPLTYISPVVYIGRRGHRPTVTKRLVLTDRTNYHLVW